MGTLFFPLTQKLRGGELQVTNLIRHYPYRVLY